MKGDMLVRSISESFTRINFLYNINDLKNLISIFEYGILSKNSLIKKGIKYYTDLSNPDVQERRNKIRVPNHGFLHDYANLYIDARNPMMYFEINNRNINELCVICVDKKILDLENVVITDRNAATELAQFDEPENALRFLDFDSIFARSWNHPVPYIKNDLKAKKCAEVLVLDKIPVNYLIKIKVATQQAKEHVEQLQLNVPIEIDKDIFFH